jgi:hypothetical protein
LKLPGYVVGLLTPALVDEAIDIFMPEHDAPTDFVMRETSLVYQSPDEAHWHAKVFSSAIHVHDLRSIALGMRLLCRTYDYGA